MCRRKKFLSSLLVAAMVSGMIAGCGQTQETPVDKSEAENSTVGIGESKQPDSSADLEEEQYYNTEGFPIVKEPISIEVAGLKEITLNWNETHVVEKIAEDMGIIMNCTDYADRTVWDTQYATMIATDTLPDLVWAGNFPKAVINEHGADGYILDLTDYLDIMPNFAKYLEENPEWAAYHKTEDGSIYSIDRIRSESLPHGSLYVSKADQEKYGFSVDDIETTEDFYNVLKSIKEQNPDIIPLSFTFDGQCGQRGMWGIRTAFGIYTCDHNNMVGVSDEGEVILYDITDNNKAYLEYLNRLWEEELLDNESFIMTSDEYQSKVRNGEVVFWHDWSGIAGGLGADLSVIREYDELVAMTSEYNEVSTYVHQLPFTASARVFVSASTEYPEAICRLIDYSFTEEGQMFFNYGTEGVTYEMIDDGFGNLAPNYDNFWDQDNYETANEWLNQEVKCVNALNVVIDMSTRSVVEKASDEQLDIFINQDDKYTYIADANVEKAIRKQAEVERFPSFTPLSYTDEENEMISQPNTDMKLLIQQYKAQFVSGKLDIEKNWDSYVKEVSGFWNQIQPVIQGAYDKVH